MFSRPASPAPAPRALARWLFVIAALVLMIVVVGGITRLTKSGLSIVEWKPIRGIVPPLNLAEWQAEFDAYKAIPQYREVNAGMTLAGFQQIYFWEYLHRLLARSIGTVLGVVLVVAWWMRAIPRGYGSRMIAILGLGGLQGVIGWWMVASGLQYRTEVSHIRLAVHLSAALLIFSYLVWTALDLLALARDPTGRPARLRGLPAFALGALAVQIVLGAFTAGLRAGYAFASWPKMGDEWFPAGGWHDGWGLAANLADNPIVVQFVHRWWAWVVAAAVLTLAVRSQRAGIKGASHAIATAVIVQIALGITTLLSGVALYVAVAHQAVAVLLLGSVIWAAHGLGQLDPVRARPSGNMIPVS